MARPASRSLIASMATSQSGFLYSSRFMNSEQFIPGERLLHNLSLFPTMTDIALAAFWPFLTVFVLEDGSVVVPPPAGLEGGGGVGLAQLVPRDHLDLAALLALGDLQVPHPVKHQLPPAPLVEYMDTN